MQIGDRPVPRLQQPAAAGTTRPPTSPAAGPAQVRDPEECDTWYAASIGYSPDLYVIPDLLGSYTSGKARNMRHDPYKTRLRCVVRQQAHGISKRIYQSQCEMHPAPRGRHHCPMGRGTVFACAVAAINCGVASELPQPHTRQWIHLSRDSRPSWHKNEQPRYYPTLLPQVPNSHVACKLERI